MRMYYDLTLSLSLSFIVYAALSHTTNYESEGFIEDPTQNE